MLGLIISFFGSFLSTLLIIRYQHLHQDLTHDHDLSGPQKFHKTAVPRIGGISILIGLVSSELIFLVNKNTSFTILMTCILCALPTFIVGFAEDITKYVSVKLRLFFTLISAALITHLLACEISRIDIPIIDHLFLLPFFGFTLTIFAITGLTNAYNIIDGFNGLASMIAIISLIALTYVSNRVGDQALSTLSLVMIFAILGFFVWNYPRGLVFLGDGGAYLIGFWIASLSIWLCMKHSEVSPWFALLVNGYPTIETLFTIYRRKIYQNKNPGAPDGIHFHTLIYRRVLNAKHFESALAANSRTAPYLWILAGLSITPAILWWKSTPILMGSFALFIILYLWLYRRIVSFKTPRWMIF